MAKRPHLTPEQVGNLNHRQRAVRLDAQAEEMKHHPHPVIRDISGALTDAAKMLRGDEPDIPRPL